MYPTKHASRQPLRVALAAAIALGSLAGPADFSWRSDRITAPSAPAAAVNVGTCGNCGVVSQVREIATTAVRRGVSTVSASRDQALVLLLIALGGGQATSAPPKIYEVSVLMDDGTIRDVREPGMPRWKAGDRVKVVRERLSSLS
jgi:hypothetical protein